MVRLLHSTTASRPWLKSDAASRLQNKDKKSKEDIALCSTASRPWLQYIATPCLKEQSPSKRTSIERFSMSLYFPEGDDFSTRQIFDGVTIQACAANQMMLSLATLEPNSVVEEHSHPHEQVGIVVEGRAIFIIGGEEKTLGPGDMYRIPGNVPHKVIALDETVKALDIFNPIREDYL